MNILEKYNLSEYLHKYTTDYTFPTPAVWKRTVKNVLYQHQSKSFQEIVTSDSDFVRFKKIHTVIKPSVIWQAPSTTAELKRLHFIIKCSVLIPRKSSEICQNCGLEFTDPINHHITTSCISTLTVRTIFWDYLVDTLTPNCSVFLSSLDNEEFLHILLGKRLSIIADAFQDEKAYFAFVKICANFVYSAVNVYYST